MSTKLVIENREFYFHPTHQAYAGALMDALFMLLLENQHLVE